MSQYFSGTAPRSREPAGPRKLVQGLLFVFIGLTFFYWIVPYARELGDFGLGRGFPWRVAQGELTLVGSHGRLRDGDPRIIYHEFDFVDAIAGIVDHPRRLLKARHFTTARVLSEDVTAPVFVGIASGPLYNNTQSLIAWMYQDIFKLCYDVEDGTRHIIASLVLQKRRCDWNDPAGKANQGSAEHTAFQDLHCSAGNVSKRERLLLSARVLRADIEPACTETRRAIVGMSREVKLFREAVMSTMSEMVSELKSLRIVSRSLSRADSDIYGQPKLLLEHLRLHSSVDRVPLESLASRASLGSPSDLDPVTAVFLCILRGSPLLSSETEMLRVLSEDSVDSTRLPPRELIRMYLNRQTYSINTTLEFLASNILPGAREFPRLIREANNTDVLHTYSNDYNDYPSKDLSWSWSNINMAERKLKGFEDGTDHLEFLSGFLVQLQHGLPGLGTRLDRWDADVARLADELTMVLSGGKKHTGRRRKQRSIGDDGNQLEITQWQLHPQNLASIQKGLHQLADGLEAAKARLESFNPQHWWQDNWFEKRMHRWSGERSVLRAKWEAEQIRRERARMSFWEYLWSLIG